MTGSLCSSPETLTTLVIGYTPIQSKWLKKKKKKEEEGDSSLPPGIHVMVKLPQVWNCSAFCSGSFLQRAPTWDFTKAVVRSFDCITVYSLSPGSAPFRFRHVGGRAECLLDGLFTQMSLLTQDVPWASMERTARWCASVRTEPTATTSPGSVPAARASWGSAVSRVSVSAQHPWALLFPRASVPTQLAM